MTFGDFVNLCGTDRQTDTDIETTVSFVKIGYWSTGTLPLARPLKEVSLPHQP